MSYLDVNGLTAICPATKELLLTMAPDWKSYVGDSRVFHCGFEGYLENRRNLCDTTAIGECFYDNGGKLVTENHRYPSCRGTPDDFPASDPRHIFPDSGGIIRKGGPAIIDSVRYLYDNPDFSGSRYGPLSPPSRF